METIQAMREVCQLRTLSPEGQKVVAGHWLKRRFIRHFSLYITWLFVKLGISANATTFLTILFGLLGVTLCVPHVLWLNVIGVLLLVFEYIFDCVDGEIARWTKQSSLKGFFLDLVSHLLCNALLAAIGGLHLYFWQGQSRYLILAFVAYGAAQYRRGLRVIYDQIIKPQIPPEARPKTRAAEMGDSVLMQLKWGAARKAARLTDTVTIRIATFFSIAASYAGITEPLVICAWFFAVFGILWVAADIVFKFYYMVPQIPHVKKV